MSRLAELRQMRAFIDREIEAELEGMLPLGRDNPMVVRVADLYSVNPADILGLARNHQVARARHGIAWLLRCDGMSLRDIARVLGYSDHATALYACRKIDADTGTKALLRGLQVVA